MTSNHYLRLALLVGSYVGVLMVGLAIGFFIGARALHGTAFEVADLSTPEAAAAVLESQLQSKDAMAKARALHAYLEFLDQRRDFAPHGFPALLASDRALTLARLSLINAAIGEEQERKAAMDQAVSLCPAMKWKECNEALLIDSAKRMDAGYFGAKADSR